MELYRVVVVSRRNIDALPIVSTREGCRRKAMSGVSESSHGALSIGCGSRRVTMRQPFESSFQAQSDQCINTARSPCGRTRNYTSLNATPSMIIVTTKILKSDHAEQCSNGYKHSSASLRSPSRKTLANEHVINDSWHERIQEDT
eukprot:scaffold27047_cov141-Skeletonema_dohrnii-CCMP3373.AAC.2